MRLKSSVIIQMCGHDSTISTIDIPTVSGVVDCVIRESNTPRDDGQPGVF